MNGRIAILAALGAAVLFGASTPLAQRLSLVIDDDGPGIAPADRTRVIERGVRTHEHVPGHGLGLAIGDSTAPGQGARLASLAPG